MNNEVREEEDEMDVVMNMVTEDDYAIFLFRLSNGAMMAFQIPLPITMETFTESCSLISDGAYEAIKQYVAELVASEKKPYLN